MKSFSKTLCAIILGGGKGSRANLGYNKVLYTYGSAPIIKITADKFAFCDQIIVVYPHGERETFESIFEDYENLTLVEGGSTRTESVKNALLHAKGDVALIHDGARPYVSRELIDRCIVGAINNGNAVPALSSEQAVKYSDGDKLISLDRSKLFIIQTPQAFDLAEIKACYSARSGDFADDSELMESCGVKINIVEGEKSNVKLTTAEDFNALSAQRVGCGYDVHRLVEGRKLILGGVEIEHNKGLLGHSDADVLTHAVMDALLSAAGLPDIGVLFPDTDQKYSGISSMTLLSQVLTKMPEHKIVNLSAVIMAQKPRLAAIIPKIRKSLANALSLPYDCVNVSATTTESLGIVGEEKGIAAYATVLTSRKKQTNAK